MRRLYHEKLSSPSQEMEENNIISNTSDFNNRLRAYVANSDIKAMEKLLANTKAAGKIKLSFHNFIVAAKGYLKAGLVNKALTMLTRSEKLIQGDGRMAAYNALIPLYAAIGSKSDVHRLCKLYKTTGRSVKTKSYMKMIRALLTLDDFDGAEKIYGEWSSSQRFNISVPEMMIAAPRRKGLSEKAKFHRNEIAEKRKEVEENVSNTEKKEI